MWSRFGHMHPDLFLIYFPTLRKLCYLTGWIPLDKYDCLFITLLDHIIKKAGWTYYEWHILIVLVKMMTPITYDHIAKKKIFFLCEMLLENYYYKLFLLYLSIYIYLSIYLSTYQFIYLSLYIYTYVVMKTVCPPDYHHSGFVAIHGLEHMMYDVYLYI